MFYAFCNSIQNKNLSYSITCRILLALYLSHTASNINFFFSHILTGFDYLVPSLTQLLFWHVPHLSLSLSLSLCLSLSIFYRFIFSTNMHSGLRRNMCMCYISCGRGHTNIQQNIVSKQENI